MSTVSGPDYQELATRLLQRVRLEHPTAGLWEAADLQWWWRVERSSDSTEQTFWLDDAGPMAAVILTEWSGAWVRDLIVVASRADEFMPTMWTHAVDQTRDMWLSDVEVTVRDDDRVLIGLVTRAGFSAADAKYAATWMDSADRSPVTPIRPGYRLTDRIESGDRPHHFIPRSGTQVAQRLANTSLYRPDLDLFIETKTVDVVSYGLFWYDPITHVGLVEPMRTEQGHEGRGLARHLLLNGLERLAALGATRLKVNYELGNQRAESLYLGVGFIPESTSTIYAQHRV